MTPKRRSLSNRADPVGQKNGAERGPEKWRPRRVGIQRGVQSEGGVQWMGVVLYNKLVYNMV